MRETWPNRAGETGPKGTKWTKWGQTWSNGFKQGHIGPNWAKQCKQGQAKPTPSLTGLGAVIILLFPYSLFLIYNPSFSIHYPLSLFPYYLSFTFLCSSFISYSKSLIPYSFSTTFLYPLSSLFFTTAARWAVVVIESKILLD